MKIRELMTSDVATCHPDDDLNDAAHRMWDRDCGCVVVVAPDAPGGVVGMLTDRDVCMAAYVKGRPLGELHVGDAMAREVERCRPEETPEEVLRRMGEAQVRRLPVCDAKGHLLGIVSLADLARAARARASGAPRKTDVADALKGITAPRTAASAVAGKRRT